MLIAEKIIPAGPDESGIFTLQGGRARVRECVNTMCARLTFAAALRAEAARPRSIFAKETDSCVCAPSKSNARAALTR